MSVCRKINYHTLKMIYSISDHPLIKRSKVLFPNKAIIIIIFKALFMSGGSSVVSVSSVRGYCFVDNNRTYCTIHSTCKNDRIHRVSRLISVYYLTKSGRFKCLSKFTPDNIAHCQKNVS